MRSGEKGFTLIELLVVMAIIATLMTLVAPRFFNQTERAKIVVLQHNRNALRAAIAAWRHDRLSGPEQGLLLCIFLLRQGGRSNIDNLIVLITLHLPVVASLGDGI